MPTKGNPSWSKAGRIGWFFKVLASLHWLEMSRINRADVCILHRGSCAGELYTDITKPGVGGITARLPLWELQWTKSFVKLSITYAYRLLTFVVDKLCCNYWLPQLGKESLSSFSQHNIIFLVFLHGHCLGSSCITSWID